MSSLNAFTATPMLLHRPAAGGQPMRAAALATLTGGSIASRPDSTSFVALLAAFSATGGTVRADDLGRLMAQHHRGDYISLARMIAGGDVFSFAWRGDAWIPMFQFEGSDLSVKASARAVRAQLTQCADGWALAAWFAMPHAALDGQRPIDVLVQDPQRVVSAARLH